MNNNNAVSTGTVDDSLDSLGDISSIWKCDKISKMKVDGKVKMMCFHCDSSFSVNASKMVAHCASKQGFDIRPCKKIPIEYRQRYDNLFIGNNAKADKRKASTTIEESDIVEQQEITVLNYSQSVSPKRKSSDEIIVTSQNLPRTVQSKKVGNFFKKPKNSIQSTIILSNPGPSGAALMDVCISDFILSNALPFSISECPKLKLMLQAAKTMPSTYITPHRRKIAGPLLDAHYNTNMKKINSQLQIDGKIFGLAIYGDGATIMTQPMINILASGVHNYSALLDIVDCTGHVSKGKKKSAPYIANLFLPHMKELDPKKEMIDLVTFDGASNVQLAGNILCVHYPRVTCIHGAEHVMSLFLGDVFKIEEFELLCKVHRRLRNIFGSTRHASTAMFKEHTKRFFNGISLTFIKPSDTRMGGEMIGLLRLLRLRDALVSTTVSSEFRGLNIEKEFCSIVQLDKLWKVIFYVCRAFYGPMRVLRLADTKVPSMDKLLYYVKIADEMLETYLPMVDKAYSELSMNQFLNLVNGISGENFTEVNNDADEEDEEYEEDSSVNMSVQEEESVCSETSGVSDNEDVDTNNETLSEKILAMWKRRKVKLVHDYSRVGWMISPTEQIMEQVKDGYNQHDMDACENLVVKLFVPSHIIGLERVNTKAELVDCFWKEWEHFTNKTGVFNKGHIWKLTENSDFVAHVWYKRYVLKSTRVLGRLGCLVLSKIVGIGSAERSWKVTKSVLTPKRNRLNSISTKKQSTIVGEHQQDKSVRRRERDSRVGKIWCENDFKTLKLDKFGIDVETLYIDENPTKIFRAWKESWENVGHLKKRCPIHEARLLKKYSNICWCDKDNGDILIESHPTEIYWKKQFKNNSYYIIGMLHGFDVNTHPDEQDDDLYDIWDRHSDFYDSIVDYYKKNPNNDIEVYKKNEAADSESEVEN